MFTIKATYRGETRKFSFATSNSFPTFEQLCNQLYRVFPISHNYYLSRLLFSPDANLPSRILIAREVHSAEDYKKCLAPMESQSWPNALFRFSVFDETPHKIPSVLSANRPQVNASWSSSGNEVPPPQGLNQSSSVPPISMFHIPPPPIIFSATSSSFSLAEIDSPGVSNRGTNSSGPQFQLAPQPRAAVNPCCSVAQGKAEVQSLITGFQDHLNKVLMSTFGSPASLPASSPPPTDVEAAENKSVDDLTSTGLSSLCSICMQRQKGSWYSCDHCHLLTCEKCHQREPAGFCLNMMGPHSMKLLPTATNKASFQPTPRFPAPWPLPPTSIPTTTSPPLFTSQATRCTRRLEVQPAVANAAMPNHPQQLPPIVAQSGSRTPTANTFSVPPPPAIHRGVVCDNCEKTIEGVRHKCLDCPDYDLCTPCISSGSAERHNPFHEFFEISEPGRVVVHTVFSGEGERNATPSSSTRPVVPPALPVATEEPVAHLAICDLCDSRIYGDRYKCLHCPDFDTCLSCFSITNEQHPGHSFVKIARPTDYFSRGSDPRFAHFASCNACTKTIYSVRFKCMHPDCPDFDLCEACEAHPISVHPDNHPLLKMKSIETVIPTVYRVGQTKLINTVVESSVTIADSVTTSQASQQSVSVLEDPSLVMGTSPFSGPDGSHALNNPVSPVDPQSSTHQAHTFPSLFPPSPPPQMIQVAPSVPKFMWGYRVDESDDFRHSAEGFRSEEKEKASAQTPIIDPLPDAHSVWPVLSPSLIATEPSDFANIPQATLDSRNIWPNAYGELNHLLQDVHSLSLSESATSFTSEPAAKVLDTSPLREEALLNRPIAASTSGAPHSLAALLNDYLPGPSPSIPQEVERTSLSATFVADITVPDGQIFPPGAEFVKCWRVVNDGGCDWPETTELVFVAGDALVIDKQSQISTVGSVKAGTEVDLWTGELKAPDAAGRYVGYWRLRDEHGNLFGNSIWIEINVAEVDSSDNSLAASSIIMPHSAPALSRTGSGPAASTTIDSTPSIDDGSSDGESDLSVISVQFSDDNEDDVVWEDSRSRASAEPAGQAMDFVLLYDDNSSSEE